MELKLTRETLRFERLAGRGGEQVTIEGEATLPGSMRDAVTVLSVQARAHLTDSQAGNGEAGVRGRVCFQVLYTQGDLTRVRALETNCDFVHTVPLPGAQPAMRIHAEADVQETEGSAASGRMTLRALLDIRLEAFETVERELIARAEEEADAGGCLQTRMQTAAFCMSETPGRGKTLVREEFDLPGRLEIAEVLGATATAVAEEISGGNGRVNVSGKVEVRVLHRPNVSGHALVTTVHEMPFDVSMDAKLEPDAQPELIAEVTDVMADSVQSDKGRTLRVEAEVAAAIRVCRRREMELLEDLYTLDGPVVEPVVQQLDVQTGQTNTCARESIRLQVSLPTDAPSIDTVMAAFAQPVITAVSPEGKRLYTEGIMNVTLIYLPQDSDIPVSVHTREPFTMTFPIEAEENVQARVQVVETTAGAATSDRVELRCVLSMCARQYGQRRLSCVLDVAQRPAPERERGFVLVWPSENETRWDTAKRLRVLPDSLRNAGKSALLAFRR